MGKSEPRVKVLRRKPRVRKLALSLDGWAAFTSPRADVFHGDCLGLLRQLPGGFADSVVTDPPAGIGFLGRDWDKDKGGRDTWVAWLASVMTECRRVLKPGGHVVVWALPRTSHRTGTAIENSGFEIRDVVSHLSWVAMPKSLDVRRAVSKVDKFAAETWKGWGTALKPVQEFWWLARKPFDGTVSANVLAHGVGGINVDGCRYAYGSPTWPGPVRSRAQIEAKTHPNTRGAPRARSPTTISADTYPAGPATNALGRFPANVYACPKSSPREREVGCGGLPDRREGVGRPVRNHHPTVKPVALMRWLTRLVTPPGGLVLDPFCGSGTTGVAAVVEGFRFLGFEESEEFCRIAAARILHAVEASSG